MTTEQDKARAVDPDVLIVRAVLHAHQRAMTPPDSGWGDMSYARGSYDHLPVFQAALSAYKSAYANTAQGESLEAIVAWGDDTFGPCTAERSVSRAAEEWAEMSGERPGSDQHAIEAADVIICLLRIPGILDAINAKMAKNRARQWKLMGDGTGYHVKPDGSTSAPNHPPAQGEGQPAGSGVREALEPVWHWYQSDEHEDRSLIEIVKDVVADLQEDRKSALKWEAHKRAERPAIDREMLKRVAYANGGGWISDDDATNIADAILALIPASAADVRAPSDEDVEAVAKAIATAWAEFGEVPFPLYDKEARELAGAAIRALNTHPDHSGDQGEAPASRTEGE